MRGKIVCMSMHAFHIIKQVIIRASCILFFILLQLKISAQDNNVQRSASDTFDIKKASFLLPQALPKGKYYQALSIIHVIIPKDWTLDVINAPMFCYSGKFTLPYGFNLQASLATLFISNRLNLGPFWNYSHDNYHFGIGYQVALNYGMLNQNQFGFKSTVIIWEQQPSISAGYSFSKSALILRGDLYWTTAIDESQGGHTVSHPNSFINGYSISAHFEQRLWKNHIMFAGVKTNYIRYHFIAWPAFPVNQYRYWVPEIHLGIEL